MGFITSYHPIISLVDYCIGTVQVRSGKILKLNIAPGMITTVVKMSCVFCQFINRFEITKEVERTRCNDARLICLVVM